MNFTFIKSNKKHNLLNVNDYLYFKTNEITTVKEIENNLVSINRSYWTCEQYSNNRCRARAVLINNETVELNSIPHSHDQLQ